MSIVIYIAVMAGITYLIRMIPFTLFRRKIRSPFSAASCTTSPMRY